MKLSIADRINLLEIMPPQADFLTIKKIQETRDKIIFTNLEIKKYEIKLETKGDQNYWVWNKAGQNYITDIVIGEVTENEIIKILKKLSDEKNLKIYQIPLYEKFVERQV